MDVRILYLFLLGGVVAMVTSLSKKGVTVAMEDHYHCLDTFALNNVTWWYDWGLNYSTHEKIGCQGSPRGEFFPMVWNYYGQKISLPKGSKHVLGFNEPNHKEQSNMTPEFAAKSWPSVEAAAGNRPLLSPAPARCETAGGLCTFSTTDWLDRFFKSCAACRVDFVALHSYTCDVKSDMHFLESLSKRYGRKVWLTEFACPGKPSLQVVMNYMQEIVPRLERAEFVAGYAWFSARITKDGYITTTNSLLESDSSTLTKLGHLYNSLG